MDTLHFKIITLGQIICRYKAPPEVWQPFNTIYEERGSSLPDAGGLLAGRLKEQRSFYYAGDKPGPIAKHNAGVSNEALNWFKDKFSHYVEVNKIKDAKHRIDAIWLNQYQPHEYNPVHVHRGDLNTGFTGVLMLKIPTSDVEGHGMLQIIGNGTGYFAKTDYIPKNLEPGDFFIFPYDMRHMVYPLSEKGDETRRTVAVNCDCYCDPVLTAAGEES